MNFCLEYDYIHHICKDTSIVDHIDQYNQILGTNHKECIVFKRLYQSNIENIKKEIQYNTEWCMNKNEKNKKENERKYGRIEYIESKDGKFTKCYVKS